MRVVALIDLLRSRALELAYELSYGGLRACVFCKVRSELLRQILIRALYLNKEPG